MRDKQGKKNLIIMKIVFELNNIDRKKVNKFPDYHGIVTNFRIFIILPFALKAEIGRTVKQGRSLLGSSFSMISNPVVVLAALVEKIE